MIFLERMSISVVGELRDSQNYVYAANEGMCIHERALSRVEKDLRSWNSITSWLEGRLKTPITRRDLYHPKARSGRFAPAGPSKPILSRPASTTSTTLSSLDSTASRPGPLTPDAAPVAPPESAQAIDVPAEPAPEEPTPMTELPSSAHVPVVPDREVRTPAQPAGAAQYPLERPTADQATRIQVLCHRLR